MTRKIQWRMNGTGGMYSRVHLYQSAPAGYGGQWDGKEIRPGVIKTLCGVPVCWDYANLDTETQGRVCKRCAAKQAAT